MSKSQETKLVPEPATEKIEPSPEAKRYKAIVEKLRQRYTPQRKQELLDSLDESEFFMKEEGEGKEPVKCPTTDGLKRLVELNIGPILSSRIIVEKGVDMENKGTAVCRAIVTVFDLVFEQEKTFEDAASATTGEGRIVAGREVDTAATRARGRAYRQFLCLSRTFTSEEMEGNPDAPFQVSSAPPQMLRMIANAFRKEGVDQEKFLEKYLREICGLEEGTPLPPLESLTAEQIKTCVNRITRLQQDDPKGYAKVKVGSSSDVGF